MLTYRHYRHRQRRRRRRRLIVFLFVVLIVVALASAQHDAHHRPGHNARAHRHWTAPATRPTPGKALTSAGASPATARHTAARLAAAGTGLTWASFHGIELPSSAQDGPYHIRDGLAWGFTDTPRGALVAAVNIVVRTAALWGPHIFAPTVHRQVTGPDTKALLRADFRGYAALRAAAQLRPGAPAGRGYAVEAAYRFAAWTPSQATVDVVSEGPTSSGTTVMVATRIQVVWRHGDWRVVAPPGGNWAASATRTFSLANYTSFANEG